MDDGMWLDATPQAAELLFRGEVKPEELVEAACARFDELDPVLNALVTRIDPMPAEHRPSPAYRSWSRTSCSRWSATASPPDHAGSPATSRPSTRSLCSATGERAWSSWARPTGVSGGNLIQSNHVVDNVASRFGDVTTTDNIGIRVEPNSAGNSILDNLVAGNGLDGITLFVGADNNVIRGNGVHRNGLYRTTARRGNGIGLQSLPGVNGASGNLSSSTR